MAFKKIYIPKVEEIRQNFGIENGGWGSTYTESRKKNPSQIISEWASISNYI